MQYSCGCGLFAFDTKGPPFRWLAGASAPLQGHCLQAPLAWTGVLTIFFPALTQVREDLSSFLG